jgi:hypothetical protein
VAAYLIEAGALLVVAPWTYLWEYNRFAVWLPAIADWMANVYVRGAVSGVGVVTALAGIWDMVHAVFARRRTRVTAAGAEPPR